MNSSKLIKMNLEIQLHEPMAADFARIYGFLNLTDNSFQAPLSERVCLKEYALKLNKSAFNIFLTSKGKDVGHVAFYLDKQKSLIFITSISVVKDFSRMGLGSELIKMVNDYAVANKIKSLSLEVQCSSENVIEFYKKLGFKLNNDNSICIFSKQVLND